MLTAAQKQFWDDNGFLILPAFFSEDETQAVDRQVSQAWRERPVGVVVDDLNSGKRSSIRDVSASDAGSHRFKVNDLYLEYPGMRDFCLDERVTTMLQHVLGDVPVLCNTLSLDKGTAQDDHIDSLYMTPLTPGKLVATWIALEDTHPDAGPLRYYPGSHRFPLFQFSDGGYNAIDSEMSAWSAHVRRLIDEKGLKPEQFLARRGDLFIWHANLLHGGGAINSDSLTRKSLVSHFYALNDCRKQRMTVVPLGDAYWNRRSPQPIRRSRLKEWLAPTVRRLRRRMHAFSNA